MSVENQLEKLKQSVANCYTALGEKGASLPSTRSLSNLASTIRTVETGGDRSEPEPLSENVYTLDMAKEVLCDLIQGKKSDMYNGAMAAIKLLNIEDTVSTLPNTWSYVEKDITTRFQDILTSDHVYATTCLSKVLGK